MLMRRFLAPVAALALFAACGDTPTAPQPLDVPGPSFAVVGQGQGAVVDHIAGEEDPGRGFPQTDAAGGVTGQVQDLK